MHEAGLYTYIAPDIFYHHHLDNAQRAASDDAMDALSAQRGKRRYNWIIAQHLNQPKHQW